MSIHRWKWRIIVAAVVVLTIGIMLASTSRNRLSSTTIIGHWQGYTLQPSGMAGHTVVSRVPLAFTFRADGVATRGGNGTEANYMVSDNALAFYNVRSRTAPPHPVLWNARIVGDTLTLSDSGPVAVLKRVQ